MARGLVVVGRDAGELVVGQARQDEVAIRPLTPDDFVARFQESAAVFWCIAAAVLNDRSGVDDVLQESAMIALAKLNQFDPSTSLTAWCGQIVRNVARNHARLAKRRRAVDADLRLVPAEESGGAPADRTLAGFAALHPDQAAFDDRVVRALAQIEETARACLLLRTLKDMSYREIALALGIPEGTASSHVHRARRALRDRLAEQASSQGRRGSGHG